AHAVLADGDSADLGDLRGDLGSGEQSAQSGLGALTELDLQSTDGRRVDDPLQPREVEAAVLVTAPEVAGAELDDQLPAVAVVVRQAAFAGVLQTPGRAGTPVECLHGGTGQRAEAHRGDVDERPGAEGPGA